MLPSLVVRRSRTLILTLDGYGLFGQDFLSRTAAWLSPAGASILHALTDWMDLAKAVDSVSTLHPRPILELEVVRLLELGFIVAAGTVAGRRDEQYELDWKWGPTAGLFHFSIKYTEYLGAEETIEYLSAMSSSGLGVALHATNENCSDVLPLPHPQRGKLLEIMRRRRSYRGFGTGSEAAITKAQLGDCVFAGLGIVGFVRTAAAMLPMKMTPSAGARNPYEAYVFAYNVKGVASGIYHYSGTEHTLGRVGTEPPPPPAALLGGQEWFSGAAAIILLVANFPRTAGKYQHPTGFRVVLIEAGHIAQNILLAATHHDLACAPTSAISDAVAESVLGLEPISQAAVYAVALGTRGPVPTIADVVMDANVASATS